VSPKRLDRVAPPPVAGEWDVRFGTSDAAKGWQELCTQFAAITREVFEQMRANPRPPRDTAHYQLKGTLAYRSSNGRSLEQWQVKVSDGGRVWYLPDDEKRTVWVVYASPAHPKQTD
jgi:mRNA-degrading endonuclease RelE of RelBE toxin-antitoxin system